MSIYIGFWTMCAIIFGVYSLEQCVKHICEMRSKNVENKARIKFMESNFVDVDYKG